MEQQFGDIFICLFSPKFVEVEKKNARTESEIIMIFRRARRRGDAGDKDTNILLIVPHRADNGLSLWGAPSLLFVRFKPGSLRSLLSLFLLSETGGTRSLLSAWTRFFRLREDRFTGSLLH